MNAKEKLNKLLSEVLTAHREYLESVEYANDQQDTLDAADWVGNTVSEIESLFDEISDSYERMSKERDRLGGLADERAGIIDCLREDLDQADKATKYWMAQAEAAKTCRKIDEAKLARVTLLLSNERARAEKAETKLERVRQCCEKLKHAGYTTAVRVVLDALGDE